MRREQRLRRAGDFAAVYNRGRAWSSTAVVVKVLPNRVSLSRFGFAVGKKLGGAVVRNKVKRRLRAIVRQLPVAEGWDVVLIAKAPAVAATYQQLQAETRDLFRRAKLLRPVTAATPAPAAREASP